MGQGTGTTILEVRLLQKVSSIREVVLHAIFMELYQAYDALGIYRWLVILEVYGVGPRSLHLLCRYWEQLEMVVLAGGYYGETFCGKRGMTQGDPLSPTVFNVVVDAVVRH